MKKFVNILAIVTAIIAVCLSAFVAVTVISQRSELETKPITTTKTAATTLQTTQTTQATTAQTSAQTTKKITIETTQPDIDFNNISVIDLFPLSLASSEAQSAKHCQGLAFDKKHGYVYYSYPTFLMKCDIDGNVIGSVTGIDRHLGDITYNEADGMLYGSLNPKGKVALYVCIIDVSKIDRKGIPASDTSVVRTVCIKEACTDYNAVIKVAKNSNASKESTVKGRYGCGGIEGITFGPALSKKETSYELLTVCYVIYGGNERNDNNYQVILQYDARNWWSTYGQKMSTEKYHASGPDEYDGKYFLYTGLTFAGVQTLVYFDELNLWLLNCYQGTKPEFKKYRLFAIDGDVAPVKQYLKNQPQKDKEYVLSLYQDGNYDKATDIYGWYSSYGSKGMDYLGDGLFYVIHPYVKWTGTQTAVAYLSVWKPEDKKNPFALAAGVSNDYTISKKERVETTVPKTTKAPTTKAQQETQSSGGILGGLFDLLT